MSKSGSSSLLNLVDVDDLLASLAEDDQIDVAVAATTAAEMPSSGGAESEQSAPLPDVEGEVGTTQKSLEETQVPQEEQTEDMKDADTTHEEKAASPGRARVRVDVDDSPLDKQLGLERFKALEKQRAEQKEQMRLEEDKVEKVKAAYAGKKWAIRQFAGPVRPQEAGELAVACAVKCGGKKNPREEIEELTRLEKEKKEQEKAAAAARLPLGSPPVKLPLPVINKVMATEGGGATKEEGDDEVSRDTAEPVSLQIDKENDDMKEGEKHGEEEAEDDEPAEENIFKSDTLDGQNGGHEETSIITERSNAAPSPILLENNEDEAPAGGKSTETRLKLKEMVPIFTCFSRRGNVREPHKPRIDKPLDIAAPAHTRSLGELVEPSKGEHKGGDDAYKPEEDEHKGEKEKHKGEQGEPEGEKDSTRMKPPPSESVS